MNISVSQSLGDLINTLFASKNVNEYGKQQIEQENSDFYQSLILNCATQYPADSVITVANTLMAQYLKNKYNISETIPEITSSLRIASIAEVEKIFSDKITGSGIVTSGSLDNWWTTKWGSVSGSILLSSSFRQLWHEEYDPISGTLVKSGSDFRRQWHGLYDPISGTLIRSGSEFNDLWERKWTGTSGSFVKNIDFDSLLGARTSSFVLRGTDFDSLFDTKRQALRLVGNTGSGDDSFSTLFDSFKISKSLATEAWVNDRKFVSSGSTDFLDAITRRVGEMGLPTSNAATWVVNQVSSSGQYTKRTDIEDILDKHSTLVRNIVTSSMSESRLIYSRSLTSADTKLSASLALVNTSLTSSLDLVKVHVTNSFHHVTKSIADNFELIRQAVTSSMSESRFNRSASRFDMLGLESFVRTAVTQSLSSSAEAKTYAYSRSFEAMRFASSASQTESSASRHDWNLWRNEMQTFVGTEISASRTENAAARTQLMEDVNVAIEQSSVGQVQTTVQQLQATMTNIQTQVSASTAEIVEIKTEVFGGEMPDWRKTKGWIYNSGSAFITADYESDKGYVVTCKINNGSTVLNPNYIVGRRRSDNSYIDAFSIGGNGTTIRAQIGDVPLETDPRLSVNRDWVLDMSNVPGNMYIKINKEEVAKSSLGGSANCKGPIFVMAANCDDGTPTPGEFKLYYMQIQTPKGKTVADLWPAIDENSIPCMYDYVSKRYVYNKGTGNFAVSPEVINAWSN